ncbi:MAG: dehydrogenase, partial [Clostridia bacterium]|nr:dehydrogenase [Clostridia bacterium]
HYRPSTTYYQNKLALLMWSLYMREQQKDVRIQAIRVTNVKIDMSRYGNLPGIMKKAYAVKSMFSISPAKCPLY